MERLRILLSAYACRPYEGSEPGVGWNVASELAKHHDVWVLTRENNRSSIELEVKKSSLSGLNFIYCEPFAWIKFLNFHRHLVYIHYYFWQIKAYFIALGLHRDLKFEIVHHVTYVRYSSPSFLSLLPVPFVWGPVGGGESAPRSFWKNFSFRIKGYECLRILARWFGERDPFVVITARKSMLAWATTPETAVCLTRLKANNIKVLSQLGLSDVELQRLHQPTTEVRSKTRFLSVGRLLHWKGFHLGLRAFAQADLPEDSEYWILGEGPEKGSLQTLVRELGISHQVKFWSQLSRDTVLEVLKDCLGLIHPSLHESGGMVCLEAMAAGLPVICLDLGGPALLVDSETGIKVPANNPEQAISDIAQAMTLLAQNPLLAHQLGQTGQKRAKELYSWTKKISLFINHYKEFLN